MPERRPNRLFFKVLVATCGLAGSSCGFFRTPHRASDVMTGTASSTFAEPPPTPPGQFQAQAGSTFDFKSESVTLVGTPLGGCRGAPITGTSFDLQIASATAEIDV